MNYIHVTEVLGVIDQGYSRANYARIVRAKRIGQDFHKHSLGWVKGNYIPYSPAIRHSDISAIVAMMVDSFKEWFGMAVKDVLHVEEDIFDPRTGIRGRPDIILRLTNDKWWRVVDLKSVAALSPVVGLQLAGYEHLAKVKYKIKAFSPKSALQFDKRPGGRLLPWLKEYPDPGDRDAFWHAVYLKNHLKRGIP